MTIIRKRFNDRYKRLLPIIIIMILNFIFINAQDSLSGIYIPPHDINQGTAPQGAHLTPVPLDTPPVGGTTVDTLFNTMIRRMPDNHTHVYSQLQAFSHDNEYVILIDHDNGYHVRRYDDLSLVNNSMGWYSAYRWIPGTHKIIILEGDPVTFRTFDCDSGTWSTLMQLPQYQYASGSRSYEELSHDGQWTAVYINNAGNDSSYIISVNLHEKRVGFSRNIVDMGATDPTWGLLEPDWVGVSPLGNYVVVQWIRESAMPASGLELYDIETGQLVRQLYEHHNHSDLGISPEGKEYIVTSESASPIDGNYPGLIVHWLDGSEPTHLRPMPWARMEHFSCQGPDGVILITAGDQFDGAYENELYAAYLDSSLRRLVHHRSTAGEYWVQPKASLSRDGKKAIWSSDWGVAGVRNAFVLENLKLLDDTSQTEKYSLTVNNGSGSGDFAENTIINVNATVPGDQLFDQWTGDTIYLFDPGSSSTTVTMPAQDITITAAFTDKPTYTLNVDNGIGGGDYQEGAIVEVHANGPAQGEIFDRWTGDTIYLESVMDTVTNVTMPAHNIAINANYSIIDQSNNLSKMFPRFYPNPFSNHLTVEADQEIEAVTVTDLSGTIKFREIKCSSPVIVLNTDKWACGTYVLHISSNKKTYNQIIIKNR